MMDEFLFEMGEPIGFLLSAAFLVVYLAALVNAAKTGRWIWFVLILISGIPALVYMVFAYETPRQLREADLRRRRTTGRRIVARDREIQALRKDVEGLKARQHGQVRREPS